jgi:hypothetical protein
MMKSLKVESAFFCYFMWIAFLTDNGILLCLNFQLTSFPVLNSIMMEICWPLVIKVDGLSYFREILW